MEFDSLQEQDKANLQINMLSFCLLSTAGQLNKRAWLVCMSGVTKMPMGWTMCSWYLVCCDAVAHDMIFVSLEHTMACG